MNLTFIGNGNMRKLENIYFEGKVTSRSVFLSNSKEETLGIMIADYCYSYIKDYK